MFNKKYTKVMKRFQIYKNGRAIKHSNSLRVAERMYEETCLSSNRVTDSVELYDADLGITIWEF